MEIEIRSIPQCRGLNEKKDPKIALVIFLDASKLEYGTVAFIRVTKTRTIETK